jgi:hypothetical protein
MKKFCITLIIVFTGSGLLFAQQSVIDDKSVSKTFECQGRSKSEILTKVENWLNQRQDAEQNVIEVFDTEKGLMAFRGESKVLYKNIGKELYPKRSGMAEILEANFGYAIEVAVDRDNYVITYTVVDMKQEMYKKQDLFFNCVNFNQLDEESLGEYNRAMDKLLKANLVFKKRREIFAENSSAQFEEVSNFLLNEGENTIFSINEAITAQ